jgi:putative pyruvate formate lyase activating enzyme
VFFSGCALRCVYCQNYAISLGGYGKLVTAERLAELYRELVSRGVHNINLVNPTHFLDAIAQSLAIYSPPIPVAYNSGGYEKVESLQRLNGKIQIYMPDFKYALAEPAARYSRAKDYPETAKLAIREMFRQVGRYEYGEDGTLARGVIIRHLILPGQIENTRRVIDWVAESFAPGDVLFSLMSQYVPCGDLSAYPEIARQISPEEYASAIEYLENSPIEDGFYQDPPSDVIVAEAQYIPEWDFEG